ncbi:MAG: PKD domain-containing protein [Candidatus Nanoarchaeia archaeon]|nr:PKD domain-containing protein [Candidatus Nanoarchaeia archaeon]
MKGKILLSIIVFLLFLNICFASRIELNLTNIEYGPQRLFEGDLVLNISRLPIDTKLVIDIDGFSTEKSLEGTCYGSIIPASYNLETAQIDNPTIEFSNAGTNTNYGFDINTYSSTKPSSVNINGFLKLTGSSDNPITSPSLDINDDGIVDWEYIGPLKKTNGNIDYLPISANYLFNTIPENADLYIRGNKKDEYCENITLPLSKSYKIGTYIKTVNSNGDLRVRIRNQNKVIINDGTNDAECLIDANTPNSNYAWKYCEINNENLNFIKKQNQNYLVCVYSKGPSATTSYYSIAFQLPSAINRGFYCDSGNCNYANDLDYFITTFYGDYEKKFDTSFNLDLKGIMTNCNNNVKYANYIHCIYPLKFMAESAGSLSIEPLSITNGPNGFAKPISKIKYIPQLIDCSEVTQYYLDESDQPIDFSDVLTPSQPGDYSLNLDLVSGSDIIESKSVDFSVVSAPTIVLNDIPERTGTNTPIIFNASVVGNEPFSYLWDFGDGNTSDQKSVIHLYKTIGEYNVSLKVTDVNGISSTESFVIQIESVKNALSSLLNSTRDSLTTFSSQLTTTASISGLSEALDFNKLVNDLNFNLTKFESDYKLIEADTTKQESAKEQEYGLLLQKLLNQRNNMPSSLNVDSIKFDSKLNSYYEIPNEVTQDKENTFNLQKNINVISNAYAVSIEYLSGFSEEYILVEKTVTVSGDIKDKYIIEYIPKTVTQNIDETSILTPNYQIVQTDPIIKWPVVSSLNILYKLGYGGLDALTETKTFLYSGEISNVPFENEPVCGDKICSPLEEGWCSDCIPKYPYGFLVFLFILVVAGVYYINFYKGKYNFKELVNIISVKLMKKRLFTNKQDLINLDKYVKEASTRMNINQIKEVLLKKGWNNKQIEFAINKNKK